MLVVYSCLLHFKDDVSVYLPFTQITVLLFIYYPGMYINITYYDSFTSNITY